ncbi:MAG: bifunctional adenosylcobinamide kinase/adenosylcobinamide-phosphate guanylyltransferase [Thiovulaceae bacterium]|nr:bifunctional adenosylcobinamide kinase/adenosylcobinamide-phosphate guanylyltransferase [Sulfurimonadaceae bacterium]
MVFVLNDVGSGVIPTNELARRFVDLSGKISQKLAEHCHEVYHVIAGLQQRLK